MSHTLNSYSGGGPVLTPIGSHPSLNYELSNTLSFNHGGNGGVVNGGLTLGSGAVNGINPTSLSIYHSNPNHVSSVTTNNLSPHHHHHHHTLLMQPTNTYTPVVTSPTTNLTLPLPHSNLYIAGIPHNWSKVHLDEYFGHFGTIYESRILIDKVTLGNRGIAFVRYLDLESAKNAIISCNGTIAPGGIERMVVRFATDKNTLLLQSSYGMTTNSTTTPIGTTTTTSTTTTSNHNQNTSPQHQQQQSMLNAALVAMSGTNNPSTNQIYLSSTSPTSTIHSSNRSPTFPSNSNSMRGVGVGNGNGIVIGGGNGVGGGGGVSLIPNTNHHIDGSSLIPSSLLSHMNLNTTSSHQQQQQQQQQQRIVNIGHMNGSSPIVSGHHHGGGGGGGGGRGRHRDPGVQLFVFHLPPQLTNVRNTCTHTSSHARTLHCEKW